jgi:hypothetical protein
MSATDTTTAPAATLTARSRKRGLRGRAASAIFVGLVVFAAVGAFVWFRSSAESTRTTQRSAAPTPAPVTVPAVAAKVVSIQTLRALAKANGRPLYWAGARPATRIEYTRRTDGTTFVRYLTGRAKAGDPSARYVVVATYAQPDAYARVSAIASRTHLLESRLANGGIAITRPGRPQNIHLVYPKLPYQIEVYAPTAQRARRIVFAGAVKPVG